jgi:hypothetical protein
MDLQPFAPAIALFGTLAVGSLGFYQWKKQNSNPNRASNAAAKREAYEGLWQRLEQINIDLRQQRENSNDVDEQLRGINTYFLSKSLYFDDRDQKMINAYVKSMNILQEKIAASGNARISGSWRATMIQPLESGNDIFETQSEVEKFRRQIKAKVQKVAGSV